MKRLLQLAAIAIPLSLASQTSMAYQTSAPVTCGEPCFTNYERSGCRCNGQRDICTCINGHWSTLS